MDRRTRTLFVVGLIVVVVASGAMALFASGERPGASPNAQTLEGVIVAVDAQGLDAVRAFTLRQADGTIALVVVGDLENGASFPPGHLVEHQATGQPIRVWYRTDGDVKVAYRIEDAT